jgi:hypothetical protein
MVAVPVTIYAGIYFAVGTPIEMIYAVLFVAGAMGALAVVIAAICAPDIWQELVAYYEKRDKTKQISGKVNSGR